MSSPTPPSSSKPGDRGSDFVRQASAGKGNLVGELWAFLKDNKKWWLGPILIVIGLMAVLAVAGGQAAIAPFIYTLF